MFSDKHFRYFSLVFYSAQNISCFNPWSLLLLVYLTEVLLILNYKMSLSQWIILNMRSHGCPITGIQLQLFVIEYL